MGTKEINKMIKEVERQLTKTSKDIQEYGEHITKDSNQMKLSLDNYVTFCFRFRDLSTKLLNYKDMKNVLKDSEEK